LVTRLFSGWKRASGGESGRVAVEAARARFLIEESREVVFVLDADERVVAASRRAREALPELEVGRRVPAELLGEPRSIVQIPYELDGSRETLVYLGPAGDQAAYEELRAGFTAAVSHELRTPLARLLALLETALLPGADQTELIQRARDEVEQVRELIDEVLFLSELETGREVVALGSTPAEPILREVVEALRESAERAGVTLGVEGDSAVQLPLRPRMLRVIAENLAANAIRYAGDGAAFRFVLEPGLLVAVDDGAGVVEDDLPRLFERFYRADQARASRGTGLGLAIVKHVVTAAGGTVEARGGPGRGLEIRCVFLPPR
jgi:signal transduction histidine kinase